MTDEQWQAIEPLPPASGGKGRQPVRRRVINGMLVKVKTCAAKRDLPERYGPWKRRRQPVLAVVTHRNPGYADDRGAVIAQTTNGSRPGDLGRLQHRARPPAHRRCEPGNHAVGCSRSGPTTKIHLAYRGHGRPLPAVSTGGNVHDRALFEQVTAAVVFRRPGPSRPATRGEPGDRGQGLPQPRHPRTPGPTRHQIDHPAEG
ncbi:transposase [Streptoalloteichus tenebrarius]|uniref:transposase n=1 Tax=Streptoalloteichus tenebrarius (strain ATCC 17920 / DSM 40477 / JCM 4838 / CBS 697.72 / NBRC 16177 / NCIMB 11028 / NRRL B-12390 / A12253. 1 / ISP 5477) TaxID=1933 RepID=UPI003557156B